MYKKKKRLEEKTVQKVFIKKVERPNLPLVKRAALFLKRLKKDFEVFSNYTPLEIGVSKQLHKLYVDTPNRVINTALFQHTNSQRYLKTLAENSERVSLNGVASSSIDAVAKQTASQYLKQRVKQHANRIRHKNRIKQNSVR